MLEWGVMWVEKGTSVVFVKKGWVDVFEVMSVLFLVRGDAAVVIEGN